MNDTELLIAAAQNAYYNYDPESEELLVDKFVERRTPWNPLKDDGDAFRLMIAANLTVTAEGQRTIFALNSKEEDCYFVERIGKDKCAATRLAIVRAAAGGRDA